MRENQILLFMQQAQIFMKKTKTNVESLAAPPPELSDTSASTTGVSAEASAAGTSSPIFAAISHEHSRFGPQVDARRPLLAW